MKRHKPSAAHIPQAPNGILDKLAAFGFRHEITIIVVLCTLAAVRIAVNCAGYPFFNNVDEQAHFEMVYRFAYGQAPHGIQQYSHDAGRLIAIYNSPEYFHTPDESTQAGLVAPPWWKPHPEQNPVVQILVGIFDGTVATSVGKRNHEHMQPPAYYMVAGPWYRLGKAIGLNDLMAIYWIRLLNVIAFTLIVWFSYVFVKRTYPERKYLHFGVPALLAFLPQDVYYSITNDIATPLFFGAAFYNLIVIYGPKARSYAFYVGTGLCVGLSVLTKTSAFPIAILMFVVAALKLRDCLREGTHRAELPRLLAMGAAAALPVAIWFGYNHHFIGTFTANPQYIELTGWRVKSFSEMWDHPILTAAGFWQFWFATLASYWRGEIVWLKNVLAWRGCDMFYAISSAVFPFAFVVSIWQYRTKRAKMVMFADVLSVAAFALSIGMLMAMSMRYDFGMWQSPSREFPYFAGGRLISGTLIPFCAVYLMGMSKLLSSVGLKRWRGPALAAIVILMIVSETLLSAPVFGSRWNFFHNI